MAIVQRIGIDVDEEGEDAGDGAALIELAVLSLEIELPFVPMPGLIVRYRGEVVVLDEILWDHQSGQFVCDAEPRWVQTQTGAEGIVERLLEAGFCPLGTDHREQDVH